MEQNVFLPFPRVNKFVTYFQSKPIFSSDGKSFRNIIVDIKCNILSVVA